MENTYIMLPSFLRGALVALAACTIVGAQPTVTSRGAPLFSNSTSAKTTGTAAAPSNCCFLVQDTISEVWWDEYSTSSIVTAVNLTSYTYYVTPMPTTTVTSTTSRIIATNATFYTTVPNGRNPLTMYNNLKPGPYQLDRMLPGVNTTQIVTAGVTIQSPAAFYVYSTVKVITAAPVTVSGTLACGTQVTYPYKNITIENVNTNAQSYWGTSIQPALSIPLSSSITTYTSVFTNKHTTGTYTQTNTAVDYSTRFSSFPSGVATISFDPYVYAPQWAANGLIGVGRTDCDQLGGGAVRYGFLPDVLLAHMLETPEISSQYPGLEKCMAGGPAIVTQSHCTGDAGEVQIAGGDLTSSTFITVSHTVQPNTAAVPLVTPATIPLSPKPAAAEPVSSAPTKNLSPTFVPVIESSTSIGKIPNPVIETPLPIITLQISSADGISAPSQAVNYPIPGTTASDAAAIASAIASLIGIPAPSPLPATTAQLQTYTGVLTVPVNPETPVTGQTTVIQGITNVILTLTSAVPVAVPPTTQSQAAGTTLLISRTLNVVIPGSTTVLANSIVPGLSGSTIVSDSKTYVVLSTPITIPVVTSSTPLAEPTGSVTLVSQIISVIMSEGFPISTSTGTSYFYAPINTALPSAAGSSFSGSSLIPCPSTAAASTAPAITTTLLAIIPPTSSSTPSAALSLSTSSSDSTSNIRTSTSSKPTKSASLASEDFPSSTAPTSRGPFATNAPSSGAASGKLGVWKEKSVIALVGLMGGVVLMI